METASFRLEDFTRLQWAPEARVSWESRFQKVARSYQRIEIDLVGSGFKTGALLVVPPEGMIEVSHLASSYGLVALVLAQQGRSNAPYASSSQPYIIGAPFDYRVAICKSTLTDIWVEAWANGDDDQIGILLGYPECCRKFFKATWVAKERVDTTWAQALNTAEPNADNLISLAPDPACNVTLRHLGLRWVSHLPCSFKCQQTIDYVGAASKVIRANFYDEYRTLNEALQWPVLWSALHGIAEIVTPVCRIISRTDATNVKYTVHQQGSLYPDVGARGTAFPFRTHTQKIQVVRKDTWTLNGFKNYESMVQAHNLVVAAAKDLRGKSIIDLGCGTGELLKIYRGIASELHGIEMDEEAASKAAKVANVRCMNIFDPKAFERKFDVAFISVQRLVEAPNPEQFLTRLNFYTDTVIFYSYGEMEGWKVIGRNPDLILGPNSAARVDWLSGDTQKPT